MSALVYLLFEIDERTGRLARVFDLETEIICYTKTEIYEHIQY